MSNTDVQKQAMTPKVTWKHLCRHAEIQQALGGLQNTAVDEKLPGSWIKKQKKTSYDCLVVTGLKRSEAMSRFFARRHTDSLETSPSKYESQRVSSGQIVQNIKGGDQIIRFYNETMDNYVC